MMVQDLGEVVDPTETEGTADVVQAMLQVVTTSMSII